MSPNELRKNQLHTNLTLLHLSQFLNYVLPLFGTLVPIIVWVSQKDENPIYRQHAGEILNFQITMSVIAAGMVIWVGLSIGFSELTNKAALMGGSIVTVIIASGGLGLFWFVIVVVNAINANKGQPADYKLSLKIFK